MNLRKAERLATLLIALGAVALLAGACGTQPKQTTAKTPPAPADTSAPKYTEVGRNAFLANCAMCHGTWGEGDGPMAAEIEKQAGVRPAGLNDPVRLAALGRGGLMDVIEKGGGRTHRSNLMPPWGSKMSLDLIGQVADYVLALPVLKPGVPRATVEAYLSTPSGKADEGRKVFVYYCTACHGPEGHGDGYMADSIYVKNGVRPRNLTDSTYFAAKTDREIYETVSLGGRFTGHSGAMPGWGGLHLTPADIKNVVSYVRVLSRTTPKP